MSTPHIDLDPEIALEIAQSERALMRRQKLRSEISKQAGDHKSLLGTYADTLQLLLKLYGDLIQAISEAESLETLKTNLENQNALLQQLLPESSKLTCEVKTQTEVIEDFKSRTEIIADLIEASRAEQ